MMGSQFDSDIRHTVGEITKKDPTKKAKVSSIYKWICKNISYDVDSYRQNLKREDDLGKVAFYSQKALCSGYTALCQRMCRAIGVKCKKIKGFVKGHGYIPGITKCKGPNHEWNAIYVDGNWHLVDPTWGSGFLQENSWEFIPHYREHYLFTDPRDFIYDHFPMNQRWQLLEIPVLLADFESWALVKPGYFIHGSISKSIDYGTINIKERVSLSLMTQNALSVTYRLYEVETKKDVSACVFYNANTDGITFEIFSPDQGSYVFTAYGKQKESEEKPVALISHLLLSHERSDDFHSMNLPRLDILWGPNAKFDDLGLSISGAISTCIDIESNGNTITINQKKRKVFIKASLYHLKKDSKPISLKGYVEINHMNNEVIIQISPLPMGTYSLVMHALKHQPKYIASFLLNSNLPLLHIYDINNQYKKGTIS